jgi:hypothetical protein
LCEPCWTGWQNVQTPFASPYPGSGPNPATAAVLGIIPGVGAMYNGQFLKGLIHVFVFAILVSLSGRHGIFGLFIAAWIVYQSFEAYHTARARRDGLPIPDPLGLNEVTNWINPGGRSANVGQAGAGPAPGAGPYTAPGAARVNPDPGWSSRQPPWQPPYQGAPGPGYQGSPPIPPIPPVPPGCWNRREPIGAVILIALGLLFLMGQLNLFSGHVFEYIWPLALIGLGAWLIVRRFQDSQGGPK